MLAELMTCVNAAAMRPRVSPLGYPTAVAALVDPATGSCSVQCAGHPTPVVLRASGAIDVLQTEGRMLGLMEPWLGEPAATTLAPGDRLVLVTDGLEEAVKEPWPVWLSQAVALPAGDFETRLAASLDAEPGSLEPVDDVTVVRIEREIAAGA